MLQRIRTEEIRDRQYASPNFTNPQPSRLVRVGLPKSPAAGPAPPLKSIAVPEQRRWSRDKPTKSPLDRPSAIPRSTTNPIPKLTSPSSIPRLAPSSFQTSVIPSVPIDEEMSHTETDDARQYQIMRSQRRSISPTYLQYRQDDQNESPVSPITDQDSGLGIALSGKVQSELSPILPPQLIPELQALAFSTAKTPTSTARQSGIFSSPSSIYSDSPGFWSGASTGTPATSLSSVSPGLVRPAAAATTKRIKTITPTPMKSKLPRLPALQEAPPIPTIAPEYYTRVRGRSKSDSISISAKSIDSSPAPTPPPRSSSVKRTMIKKEEAKFIKPIPRSAIPTTKPVQLKSALVEKSKQDQTPKTIAVSRAHADLQQSINIGSSRKIPDSAITSSTERPVLSRRQSRSVSSSNVPRPALEVDRKQNPTTPVTDPPPRSPGRLTRLAKLGIFNRPLPPIPTKQTQIQNRLQRKGPAAGTGYDNYPRQVSRGRKPATEVGKVSTDTERSVSSTTRSVAAQSRKFSSSSTRQNRGSQSDLEEFVASRMKPVWMIGGSGHQETMLNTSPLDMDLETTEIPFILSEDDHHVTLEMSGGLGPVEEPVADYSMSTDFATIQKNVPEIFIPPTHHTMSVPRSRAESFTSCSSIAAPSRVSSSLGGEMYRFDVGILRSPEKKPRKLNWNIFRRKRKDPETVQSPNDHTQAEVSVNITATAPQHRTVPYYAMMESEIEVNDPGMGELLAEAIESAFDHSGNEFSDNDDKEREEIEIRRKPRASSALLPPVPFLSAPTRKVSIDTTAPTFVPEPIQEVVPELESQSTSQNRRPRLAQVGRIPQVTPKGVQNNTVKRPSVSRHFQNLITSRQQNPVPILTQQPMDLEIHSDFLPSRTFSPIYNPTPVSAPVELFYHQNSTSDLSTVDSYQWPSHHFSEASISSSSDGIRSIMAPSLMPSEVEVPIIYRPSIRPVDILREVGEDEIWNEYDELIDHVMSPSKTLKSIPVYRVNSQMNNRGRIDSSTIRESRLLGKVNQGSARPQRRERVKLIVDTSVPRSLAPPVVFPNPQSLSDQNIGEDIRLRRSRIVSALHSSYDPSSPFSMREFLNEYGSRWRDSSRPSARYSTSTLERSSLALSASPAKPSRLSILPQSPVNQQDSAALLDSVERSKDPIALSELHFTSLMVARWLSFGRVLFSPAHNEIHLHQDRRVLIIDGLGSEDWAIYCAVTYEARKALVYDLREKSSRDSPRRVSQHSPPNLRRAEVSSLMDRFPFPPNFFTAVVLRFPPAMSEKKMKNILSECKKILVPGGFLELMLLDIDIVNMGVQTRRAVRELKIKMTTIDRDVSLRPMIDNAQTILGHEGYINLSRCVVGVPVEGSMAASSDSSSRSSKTSENRQKPSSKDLGQSTVKRPKGPTSSPQKNQEGFSLNDLLGDHSENADAQIGKMVSRTARSWWQRCFEAAVLVDGDISHSIFADKRVIQECKTRFSSFKLLIAHAQRPIPEMKRRTMSDSAIPILSTAGPKKPFRA